MKSKLILVFFAILRISLHAQIVGDAVTREPIPGAHVFIYGTTIGTSTNEYGIFDFARFPNPPFQLHISMVGYETGIFEIPDMQNYGRMIFLLETKTLEGVTIIHHARCNSNVPGWGESLGTISFVTDKLTVVTNGMLIQTWSDDVTATNCQKTIFNGGDCYSNFNADCRSNPVISRRNQIHGDFFSWCAVVRFADKLCPYPWRVPTRADFTILNIILNNRSEYFSRWNAKENGFSLGNGLVRNNADTHYWSQQYSLHENLAYSLYISPIHLPAHARPQKKHLKSSGLTLRCVL